MLVVKASKGKIRKRTAQPTADRGSRFVPCPICGATVAWYNVNGHLDSAHAAIPSSSDPRDAPRPSQQPTVVPQSQLDPSRDIEQNVQHIESTAAASSPQTLPQAKPGADSAFPQPWWQPRTLPLTLASARFASRSRQQLPLTDEELRCVTPCEVVRNALPLNLANSLLKVLLADSATWVRGTWYIGGKKHSAPRRSAYYRLSSTQEIVSANGASEEALDVSSSVDTRAAPQDLQEAATIISEHVQQLIPRVCHHLAADDRESWHSSYALCNMYQDGQEGVGPHADRLTMLGPRPIIASLSLGATRTFRLRCMAAQGARLHTSRLQQEPDQAAPASQHADHTPSLASSAQTTMNVGLQHIQQRQAHSSPRVTDSGVSAHPAQPEGKAQQADAAQQAQEEAPVSSIDVVLPHNTLVIMWPPMQEAWKHEIPKCKHVTSHPMTGKARINLTFRQLKPAWAEKAPCCRCGQRAVMKASLPSSAATEQQYYYTCDNTKGPGCGFFLRTQVPP
ncbi:hypothetical protein ABBQ32_001224 [Trebouxia sp. C0010 RCD-2024]